MPIILDGTTGITTPGITNTGTFVFQGPVQVPAGSAATASITTAAGANTGIFFPSSSSVAITTAGTQRFVVSASGDVGIGTSSPTDTGGFGRVVDVQGSTGAQVVCRDSDDTTKFARLSFDGGTTNVASIGVEGTDTQVAFRAGGGEKMRLTASGNLGLGVTPSAWWSSFKAMQVGTYAGIASGSGVSNYFNNAFFDGTNFKYLNTATAAWYQQDGNQHKWYFANSGTAGNNITFTQIMYAGGDYFQYANGAVSHSAFDINIGVGAASWNYGYIRLGQNNLFCLTWGGGASGYGDTVTIKNPTNGPLVFGTNDTERARISSGGQFCIGTTGTAGDARLRVVNEDNTSGDFLIVGQMGGNAINTSSYQYIGGNYAGSDNVYIYGNGNIVNTNNSYGTLSDVKLKQDIIDAASQWDDVKAFKFRKFRFKEEVSRNPNAPHQLGLIAQELEQTSPGLVDTTPDRQKEGETMKTIKTSVLLMKATKALQEAMARIEVLEADMAVLKGSN